MAVNTPKLPQPEQDAYKVLIDLIEDAEAHQVKGLSTVINSDEYKLYTVGYVGCEIISLYVTPQNTTPANENPEISFLHEVSNEAIDYPMYTIKPANPAKAAGEPPYANFTIVDKKEVDERRRKQKNLLSSTEERTSAKICAHYLRGQKELRFILSPFGELLTYCYLYKVLEIKQAPENSELDWAAIAKEAWNKVTEAHEKRFEKDSEKHQAPPVLLEAIQTWYTVQHAQNEYRRDFLGNNKINAVYNLESGLPELLVKAQKKGEEPAFLTAWAQSLYNSLELKEQDNEPLKTFWQRTLINPEIELLFGSHGLYVTIIKSPITYTHAKSDSQQQSTHISEAHAICTVFDTALLEDPRRRRDLDRLLKIMSDEDIATYDYKKLNDNYKILNEDKDALLQKQKAHELIQMNHKLVQDFLDNVSSPNDNWHDLIQAAATVCLSISSADHAIVSLKDIGTYVLTKNTKSNSSLHDKFKRNAEVFTPGWFNHISPINNLINKELFTKSPAPNSKLIINDNKLKELKQFISEGLSTSFDEPLHPIPVPVEGKDRHKQTGVIIVFTKDRGAGVEETARSLQQIATALFIGFKLPFRSMTNKGLLSKALSLFIEDVNNPNQPGQSVPQLSTQRWADRFLATMLEVIQLFFFCIGIFFLYSILLLPFGVPITDVLKKVEKTVMAFSICLAAMGILFLLRPELSITQPKWMQRFAHPGTLEQTLVKLAAMVLTIDVLSVVLNLQEMLQSSTTYLWILVKPAIFHLIAYLIILVGLAFLSHFLLNEEEHEKDGAHTK